jgi:nucleotide-binding universal stress UspA family protein
MAGPIILCTDGSEAALAALRAGLDLLGPGHDLVLVTVVEPEDPTLVTGAGFQGGVMSPDEFDAMESARNAAGAELLVETASALGLSEGGQAARREVLAGTVGPAICRYAHEQGAAAIVMGTRGRRGITKAFLGSVGDHVVRGAGCPVLITNAPT